MNEREFQVFGVLPSSFQPLCTRWLPAVGEEEEEASCVCYGEGQNCLGGETEGQAPHQASAVAFSRRISVLGLTRLLIRSGDSPQEGAGRASILVVTWSHA